MDGKSIDWSMAEILELIDRRFSVRLSVKILQRYFSQRHAVLRNQESHERYIPLNNISKGQKI